MMEEKQDRVTRVTQSLGGHGVNYDICSEQDRNQEKLSSRNVKGQVRFPKHCTAGWRESGNQEGTRGRRSSQARGAEQPERQQDGITGRQRSWLSWVSADGWDFGLSNWNTLNLGQLFTETLEETW